MKIYNDPPRSSWSRILKRPALDAASLAGTVKPVLDSVRVAGDAALYRYTEQFDGVVLSSLSVKEEEINAAAAAISEELKQAIRQAADNISKFHTTQLSPPEVVETMPGIRCWRKSVGIEKVGLYIPGGTAPLFSTLLMLGIPAKIAGCREIVLCSPPDKQGNLHPAILYAASVVGVTRIFKLGGVQAIAAMAYGTETVPAVSKIFGPGNQYVTCAKQLVQQDGLAIDMPAGPSEVAVFADASADPAFVAADLLSQAEHGADSQVLLVTTEESLLEKTRLALQEQLDLLPRKELAARALQNSTLIYMPGRQHCLELLNQYAAEHLILACEDAESMAEGVINAGSVFIGHHSPESVGDYASGTNHTLPTNGYATAYSGVSVDSFVRKITFQQLSVAGLDRISGTVIAMARAEGLEAHARAVEIRLKN